MINTALIKFTIDSVSVNAEYRAIFHNRVEAEARRAEFNAWLRVYGKSSVQSLWNVQLAEGWRVSITETSQQGYGWGTYTYRLTATANYTKQSELAMI